MTNREHLIFTALRLITDNSVLLKIREEQISIIQIKESENLIQIWWKDDDFNLKSVHITLTDQNVLDFISDLLIESRLSKINQVID